MSFPEDIHLVVYINLNTRTDRRQEMETELKRMGVPPEKILRWEATRNKNGALGCSMSHVAVLEHIATLPPTVQNILILEDDFNFTDEKLCKESLNEFLTYPRDSWDMALLSYEVFDHEDYNALVSRCFSSSYASGYLINRDSLGKVLANFKEGLDQLIKTGKEVYHVDLYWWRIMKNGKTFYFNKPLGYQRESYSNIASKICRRDSTAKQIPRPILWFYRA